MSSFFFQLHQKKGSKRGNKPRLWSEQNSNPGTLDYESDALTTWPRCLLLHPLLQGGGGGAQLHHVSLAVGLLTSGEGWSPHASGTSSPSPGNPSSADQRLFNLTWLLNRAEGSLYLTVKEDKKKAFLPQIWQKDCERDLQGTSFIFIVNRGKWLRNLC